MKKQYKRLISLTLLLGLISLLFAFPVSAAYENTHVNTGNQAEDILAIAATQVGYKEGANNETKFGAWYPMNYNPWCAMFVSWCAEQAGIAKNVIPKHASCDVGMNWFKSKNKWENSAYHGGSYIPKAGDIIYFGVIGDSNHVGIVRYSANGYVYTVEGNASDMVINKSYPLSSEKILGYGLPAYSIKNYVSGNCGTSAKWNFNLDSGVLTISGSGDMQGWALPGDQPWAGYLDQIKAVSVEESITSIGVNAFAGCINLTEATLPNGLTSIQAGAFMGCVSLGEITVPESVTVVGDYAFYGCAGLKKATIISSSATYGKQIFHNTPADFVLYGYSASTSRTYASVNGHSFIALDAPAYIKGDINSDGNVDILDAIVLFMHSMIPEQYPLNYPGSADFTDDGSIDIADAIRLFMYSMLPEQYPL